MFLCAGDFNGRNFQTFCAPAKFLSVQYDRDRVLRGAAEMRADYSNSSNAPLQSASSSTSSIAARVKVYARRGPVWEVRKCARGEKESRIVLRQRAILLRFHRHTESRSILPSCTLDHATPVTQSQCRRFCFSSCDIESLSAGCSANFEYVCDLCCWTRENHRVMCDVKPQTDENCCYCQIRRVNKLVVAARSHYQTCTECGQTFDLINTKTQCSWKILLTNMPFLDRIFAKTKLADS